MTLKEAAEAGTLVEALKGLNKERRSVETEKDKELGFEKDLYVPRAIFIAMVDAGLLATRNRLKELGVEVPEDKA